MTKTEKQIKRLQDMRAAIDTECANQDEQLRRYGFMLTAFGCGYSVSLIGFVTGITEQSVYRWLRKFPVQYEEAKAKREALKRNNTVPAQEKGE